MKDTIETQEITFTEMAYTRYHRTWLGFEAVFRRGESTTLSAYCKQVHVSYEGMKKWVSAINVPSMSKNR